MRHLVSVFASMSILAAINGCGAPLMTDSSGLRDDTRPLPGASRVEPAQFLDLLSEVPDRTKMPDRAGVTSQHLDAAVDKLDKLLTADPVQKRLKLDDRLGGTLNPKQRTGLNVLLRGYNERLQTGDIKVVQGIGGNTTIAPADGRTMNQGIGPNGIVRPDGGVIINDEDQFGAGRDVSPEHRIGNGYWSWSLSYKWWGVRLSVNHNFLNYLCHNTEWMLSRANLPGWIKIVIRPLGCLLHGLDTGANGASISITWTGVFWYTP